MGMYPEHLIEMINEDVGESIYDESMENIKPEDFEKPKCYIPNDDPYPQCKGACLPRSLTESSCRDCCLYEDYDGDDLYEY